MTNQILFDNQYLTFEEYQELKGTLKESAFNLLEFEARKQVDKQTLNRLVSLQVQEKDTKLCIFKLITLLDGFKGNLKGESVDGWSRTYLDQKEQEKALNNVIEDYLINMKLSDGTPYMWRG